MPTKPTIPKDLILKNALELLIAEGYEKVNIKTIAKKIGCSTQPISWHFKNMESFRIELKNYALKYANSIMDPKEKTNIFNQVKEGYIKIAYDIPNLFKYLYLDGGSKYHLGNLNDFENDTDNVMIAKKLAKIYEISLDDAKFYVENIIIYTHGLLVLVTTGILTISKDEVRNRIQMISQSLLNGIKGK